MGELVTELAARWEARCESERHDRRQGSRRREAGAGPKYELGFTDRLLATLVHLRTGLTYEALGVIYQVGKSTIGRAVAEVRPLLAARGFAVPQRAGLRLRTLEDVFAYAEAEGVTLRIDGMETQVRRPRAHRPGRRAFVSGKRKQNTVKTTTISDGQGRTLWSGAVRPGRMHDQTRVRTKGIAEQFRMHLDVRAEVDDGYRGLANEFPGQVSAPPRKPKNRDADTAPLTEPGSPPHRPAAVTSTRPPRQRPPRWTSPPWSSPDAAPPRCPTSPPNSNPTAPPNRSAQSSTV
ncbi:transposase family protein [Streptomyces sp. NPDC056178]|uniref:transposase family protein n=1 Tax=Streptomyces sp. NPDC056178 TaxID=3345735 RepID=UPI0035E0A8A0